MKKRFLALILIVVFLAGCAGMGIKLDTTEKKYLAARTELNLILEQYVMMQGRVSLEDHAVAKEAFYSADVALDTWEMMLGQANYNFSNDVRTWLKAKNAIITVLRKYYGGDK